MYACRTLHDIYVVVQYTSLLDHIGTLTDEKIGSTRTKFDVTIRLLSKAFLYTHARSIELASNVHA